MRLAWLAAALLALAACAARGVREEPPGATDALAAERLLSARESQLFERARFELEGRIAVSDGKDGGSGRFEWQQRGAATSLRFYGPASARNWRLEVQPGQALLIESNGAVRTADSAQALLARELRWQFPADALRYWVLGMRAPGGDSEAGLGADGQLAWLHQSGWEIRYLAFDFLHDPPLPRKLYARRGEHQLRISVRRWDFQE
ncbi:MAG: outer membrane lipoprotein LolB [Xanthomonadales bacterium PRO6]|nr:Outer-membrane lipoprotein LolB [Xanthomonadales bacterium]MCE7931839.1 outer membrane lipoprotein LolB [Xanthomonadales bacterium PRO6]